MFLLEYLVRSILLSKIGLKAGLQFQLHQGLQDQQRASSVLISGAKLVEGHLLLGLDLGDQVQEHVKGGYKFCKCDKVCKLIVFARKETLC